MVSKKTGTSSSWVGRIIDYSVRKWLHVLATSPGVPFIKIGTNAVILVIKLCPISVFQKLSFISS